MSSSNPNSADLIKQYDIYARDLGNIGTRHSQTSSMYVSILSALLVFLSLTGEDKPLGEIGYVAILSVAFLGMLICVLWYLHIQSFGCLYRAKFGVLREMEQQLPFHCYKREWELLDPKFLFFSRIERFITLILTIPFIILLIHSSWQLISEN